MDDMQRRLDQLLISEPSVDAIDTWLESTAEEFPDIMGETSLRPDEERNVQIRKREELRELYENNLKEILNEESQRKEKLRVESPRKENTIEILDEKNMREQYEEKQTQKRDEEKKREKLNEETRQEELRKKELRQKLKEELRQDKLRKDEVRWEELRQQELRQDALQWEELRQIRQRDLRQEELRQEELRQDELRQEVLQQIGSEKLRQTKLEELNNFEPHIEPQYGQSKTGHFGWEELGQNNLGHYVPEEISPENSRQFEQEERSHFEHERFKHVEQEDTSQYLEPAMKDTEVTLASFCAHLDDYAQSDPISEIKNLIVDPDLPTPHGELLVALLEVARKVPQHNASLHPWTSALAQITSEHMQQQKQRQEKLRVRYTRAVNYMAQRAQAEVLGHWRHAIRDVLVCNALLNRWNIVVKKQYFVTWRLRALPPINAATQTKQILQSQSCSQLVSYWRYQLRARRAMDAQAVALQRARCTQYFTAWQIQLNATRQLDWRGVRNNHLRQLCLHHWRAKLDRLHNCEVVAVNLVRKRVLTMWIQRHTILHGMPVLDHSVQVARKVLKIWQMQHQATKIQAKHLRSMSSLVLRNWRATLYMTESRALQFRDQALAAIEVWRQEAYQHARVNTLLDRVLLVQDQAVAKCILDILQSRLADLRILSQNASDFHRKLSKRESLNHLQHQYTNSNHMLEASMSTHRRLLGKEALKMMRAVYAQQRDERLRHRLEYAQIMVGLNTSAAILAQWHQNLKRIQNFCTIIDSSALSSTKQTIIHVWHEALEATLRLQTQVAVVRDEWATFRAMQAWKEGHNAVIELEAMANQQRLAYQALEGRNVVRRWHIQALKRVQLHELASARYSTSMKRLEVLVFHKWQQKTRPSLQLSTPRRGAGTPSTSVLTEMSPRILKRLNTSNRRVEIYSSPRRNAGSAGSDVSEVYTPTRGPRSTRPLSHDSLRLQ